MQVLDYTTENGCLPHLACGSLSEAVTALVDCLVAAGDVSDGPGLVTEVMRREVEGSTAVGGGLVIPHARFAGVKRIGVAVATLVTPVAAASPDGRPVDVVILLVGPLGDPRPMLQVLARLARLVRQRDFAENLRGAADPAALRGVFARD